MNNKIYKKLFVGFGFVSIVLILTLFVMSQTYIQNLVYHERLSQMEEVTHQMFHSLWSRQITALGHMRYDEYRYSVHLADPHQLIAAGSHLRNTAWR